jgi:sugar/nucleoside kinase (ribokinase family)
VSATNDSKNTTDAPTIKNVKIKTGAGDNFNAGFCNGLLYGLNCEEMILSGVATSSYYVGHGKSPTIPEVVQFLKDWGDNKL